MNIAHFLVGSNGNIHCIVSREEERLESDESAKLHQGEEVRLCKVKEGKMNGNQKLNLKSAQFHKERMRCKLMGVGMEGY